MFEYMFALFSVVCGIDPTWLYEVLYNLWSNESKDYSTFTDAVELIKAFCPTMNDQEAEAVIDLFLKILEKDIKEINQQFYRWKNLL